MCSSGKQTGRVDVLCEPGAVSRRVGCEERVDALVLFVGQTEVEHGRQTFDLLRATAAYDRSCDGGMMERPGYGNHTGFDLVRAADLAKEFYKAEIAAQARLVELYGAAAPIILREVGDALSGHFTREKAGDHW